MIALKQWKSPLIIIVSIQNKNPESVHGMLYMDKGKQLLNPNFRNHLD